MAQFDVYLNSNTDTGKTIPYLLDVQADLLDRLATRVVVPLILAKEMGVAAKHLNPQFKIKGTAVVMSTAELAGVSNRLLGEKIGKGLTLEQALSEMTMVAEGVKTCESAYQLAQANDVTVPLIQEVYLCLYKGKKAIDSLHDLLRRTVHSEMKDLFK